MEKSIRFQTQKIQRNKSIKRNKTGQVANTKYIIFSGGVVMAKKGQEATWENDHFKGPKKPRAAKVPEVNPIGNGK